MTKTLGICKAFAHATVHISDGILHETLLLYQVYRVWCKTTPFFINAECLTPLQKITHTQWTSRVLNMTPSIDANFDRFGNAKWCCFSKALVWSNDKKRVPVSTFWLHGIKKDASVFLPALLDANIKTWKSAWGMCFQSSFESAPWSDAQYLGCTGWFCWLIRLMLLPYWSSSSQQQQVM